MVKRRYPILLVISVYIYILSIIIMASVSGGMSIDVFVTIIIGHIIVVVIFIIPNIIYAIKTIKHEVDCISLLFWSKFIKLLFIPIYVAVYLLGVVMAINPMTWIFVIMFVIFDISLLIPSSIYTIIGLVKAKEKGYISSNSKTRHIIFQFIFVIDLISAIYITRKVKAIKTNLETELIG